MDAPQPLIISHDSTTILTTTATIPAFDMTTNANESAEDNDRQPTASFEKQQDPPLQVTSPALITAFSYEQHIGLVPFLPTVIQEAEHISAVLPCIQLENPSFDTFKGCLPACKAWFFLGKGGVVVRNRHALVFIGENGLTSNGLVAISTNLLVSTINAHGTHLRLVVLNGCKTFGAAQSILLQCPTVEYCICWTTLVESKAASIFAKAFADMLAVHSYFTGNDSLATVFKAFHGAKAAVLEETQLAHARGIGPIGMPVYAFIDPQDDFTTYQECPCNNRCQNCSCAKTEDRTPRKEQK